MFQEYKKSFSNVFFSKVSRNSPVPNPNKIPWCLKGGFTSLFRVMPKYCGLYKEDCWILLIHLRLTEKIYMKFNSSFSLCIPCLICRRCIFRMNFCLLFLLPSYLYIFQFFFLFILPLSCCFSVETTWNFGRLWWIVGFFLLCSQASWSI